MPQPRSRRRSRSFSWTSNNDVNISHCRLIGCGGSSEVHEMLNNAQNQRFARKILRVFGDVTEEDVENEVEIIIKMCTTKHRNIVQILGHGDFTSGQFYFIDMELCALNLQDYIYHTEIYWVHASTLSNMTSFVPEDSSAHLKLINIWIIISHIAQGLEFIHTAGYVHRDLKPPNSNLSSSSILTLVLYSKNDNLWKIADFGLTSEGTSKHSITTVFSRGSNGYRAPEVLLEAKFNNKVDIWGLGCIFYELAEGKKAFDRDDQLHQFSSSHSTLYISNPVFPVNFAMHMSKFIHEMLERDPCDRPVISDLCLLIESYCIVLDPSILRDLDDISNIPEYHHWKKFVRENSDVIRSLFSDVSELEESRRNKLIRFLIALVDEFPNQQKLMELLVEWYEEKESWNSAIRSWQVIVTDNSPYKRLHQKLEAVLRGRRKNTSKIMKKRRYGLSLYEAAECGKLEDVKALLDKATEIKGQGVFLGNAMQVASFNGHEAVVRLLLDKGADVNAKGGEYGNALHAASLNGHEAVVRLLLNKGADVNEQNGFYGNALQAASRNGHEAVVVLLLDKGADVNEICGFYGNALQAASRNNHEAVVRLLIDKGADINVQSGFYGNALQAALPNSDDAVVRLLLERGAKVDTQRGSHSNDLQGASYNDDKAIVGLLGKVPHLNLQGGEYDNALQIASRDGHEAVVQSLLDKGADVNAQRGEYGNALQAASSNGQEGVVRLLLDKGADVNSECGFYGNALQAASHYGHEAVVRLLLNRGADVNARGGFYGNALQAASRNGHKVIVGLLLDTGADVDVQGGFYGTALHAASRNGHEAVVQSLLDGVLFVQT